MKKLVFIVMWLIIFVCPLGCIHQEKEVIQNKDVSQNKDEKNEMIDISQFSKTMAFAEMSNIYFSPEEYIGRSIKVKGEFGFFQASDNTSKPIPDQYRFLVILADEMGCCGVAMEFIPKEEYKFPEDFPPKEDFITITGMITKDKNEYGQEDVRIVNATIMKGEE